MTIQNSTLPNWATAPEWANYLTMDADGEWYWWEYSPTPGTSFWTGTGRVEYAGHDPVNWKYSLSSRPEDA